MKAFKDIAEAGQKIINSLKVKGNKDVDATATEFNRNPRIFDSAGKPTDRPNECLKTWNQFEWEIAHVKSAVWWLEEKSLKELFAECKIGMDDWQVYNYAYEIIYGKPRSTNLN
jgi:hypothetical protein